MSEGIRPGDRRGEERSRLPSEAHDPHVNRAPDYKAQYGRVQASVWRREVDDRTVYGVSLTRSYKDEYDRWQRTTNLDEDDLLPGAKALDDAYGWVQKQRRAARQEANEELRTPPRASNT